MYIYVYDVFMYVLCMCVIMFVCINICIYLCNYECAQWDPGIFC